jgi:sugar lactone lactonase YvrE
MPAFLTATLALDVHAELGEGPVWDCRTGRLYFVDILSRRVLSTVRTAQSIETFQLDRMVGAAAPAENGDWVLAVEDAFVRLDPGSGAVRPVAPIDHPLAAMRMNDGKCDPSGRFWAGSMAVDERPHAGRLYRLDPDGRVHTMLHDVSISNGLDWSDDDRVMYFIDSPTRSIDAFDFDNATGAIANRRTVVRVDPAHGFPDGMTVDADGHLWVALWGGGAVHRYAPDGTLDSVVTVPTTFPTSCAFGGADLRDLYITTACVKLSSDQRARQRSAGGVFVVRPGVAGRQPRRFRG